MPEWIPVMLCLGFLVLAAPWVVCIVLLVRLADHARRLKMMEMRVSAIAGDLAGRQTAGEPASAGIRQPARTAAPPAPVVAPTMTGQLLQRQVELRGSQSPAVIPPAAPTPPSPAAPQVSPPDTPFPRHSVKPSGTAAAPPIPTEPAGMRPSAPPVVPAPRPPRPGLSLEAFIGVRLFVILGAIVLALAGIFLVKVGIERKVFTPELRVYSGIVAGLAMLAAAQWRRKRETFLAQGFSAAGIVALFAAFYAATSLFDMLTQAQGFLLLAATTALAVVLSLQRPGGGPLIATLGLIGGFITPILVRTDVPNVPGLFAYLMVLHVGLITVTRIRGWPILAALSMLFSSVWLIGWLLFMDWRPADGPFLGTFMLGSTLALVPGTLHQPRRWGASFVAILLTWFAAAMGLVTGCLLLRASGFSDLEWMYLAILLGGTFVLARIRPSYEGLAWLSALAVVLLLAVWAGVSHRYLSAEELPRLRGWLIGLGAGSVMAAYICQWRSAMPARWGMLTVLLALVYVGAAYFLLGVKPRPDAWAWLPLAGAGVLAVLAAPLYLRRTALTSGEENLTVFAHGILGMLVIAPPMAWHHATLTAAWAGLLPLAALAVWRLRITGLFLGLLGVALMLIIRAITLWDLIDSAGDHRGLWWNPVIWAYVPLLLSFGVSAWMVERVGEVPQRLRRVIPAPRAISALLQVAAAGSGFLLITLLTRWHFHDGRLDMPSLLFLERGAMASLWLLAACLLVWLGSQLQRPALLRCGQVLAVLGLIFCLLGVALIGNPFFWNERIDGSMVLNTLLFYYGMPALLCGLLACLLRRTRGDMGMLSRAAGCMGLLLVFALSAMQVRHGFQASVLHDGNMALRERGTYPLVWMGLGGVLLAAERFRRLPLLRSAGLVFVTAGLAFALLVSGLVANPLATGESVGSTPVFNWLLYILGLPALGAGALALALENRSGAERRLGVAAAIGALLLAFLLVTLEVQQGFRGAVLGLSAGPTGEMTAYTLAWAALGGALLVGGILRQSMLLRWASLVMMLVTVIKLFIFDLRDLGDLERVASFAGLGLSLMALAFVYQRFVFRKVPPAPAPPP